MEAKSHWRLQSTHLQSICLARRYVSQTKRTGKQPERKSKPMANLGPFTATICLTMYRKHSYVIEDVIIINVCRNARVTRGEIRCRPVKDSSLWEFESHSGCISGPLIRSYRAITECAKMAMEIVEAEQLSIDAPIFNLDLAEITIKRQFSCVEDFDATNPTPRELAKMLRSEVHEISSKKLLCMDCFTYYPYPAHSDNMQQRLIAANCIWREISVSNFPWKICTLRLIHRSVIRMRRLQAPFDSAVSTMRSSIQRLLRMSTICRLKVSTYCF